MNGRVYDPLVGRFMSGDPHITDLINGQNHNRYSYVLNNPTNLTDPTGFDVVIVTGDRCLICKALEATSGVWEYTKVAAKNVEKAVSRTIPVVKKIIPVAIKRVVKTQAVLAIPGAGEVLDGLLTADIVYEASKEIYQAATNDGTNNEGAKDGEKTSNPDGQKTDGNQNSVPDKPDGKVTVPSDKWWKDQGIDPHEIKDGQGDSRRNLGVDKNGNIWSVDRRGSGNPQYEGNIQNYR